jgi:hypothetical protein
MVDAINNNNYFNNEESKVPEDDLSIIGDSLNHSNNDIREQ